MIIDKQIKSIPQLGFFSVTDINSDWSEQNLQDHMTQASLTYKVFNGLKVAAGLNLQASYDLGLSSLNYFNTDVSNRVLKLSIGYTLGN